MSTPLQRLALTGTILLAAAALVGCASNAGGGDPYGSAPDPVGTWGDTAKTTEPSLELADDGGLAGTDGCNRLTGEWTQDGDTIEFGDVASTMMACEDVDTWLSGLATGTIDGDTMTVLDADGEELGTLERAE